MRRSLTIAVLLLAACGPDQLPTPHEQKREGLSGVWQTGGNVGYGIASMDTGNPLGANVFIGYAGYNISLGEAEAWVGALYDAKLRNLGVRYLFAVQGPADSGYNGLEIGNSRIVAALVGILGQNPGFILVAGHSSGSFVADELLQQLDTGADPFGVIGSKMVFFNLDGDQKYVGPNAINRLRRAYYVNAWNPQTGAVSWNHGAMNYLGGAFAGKGGTLEYDASSSGCTAGGCAHISLINGVPHNPNGGSGIDYADFGGRWVNQWWIDAKQGEAGLGQCMSAFTTIGAIEQHYEAMGGCGSTLGAPTTNELPTASGAGRFNNFEYGAIYWSFFTGAHDVRGAIYANWASLNYENGYLGYPTSDELVTFDTFGRYNRFEHGAIYWNFFTGAHAVIEPVYTAWANANYENGALGYPIGDTRLTPDGVQNEFQKGTLTVLADGSSRLVLNGSDAGVPIAPQDAGGPTVEDAGTPDAGASEEPTTQSDDAGVVIPAVDAGAIVTPMTQQEESNEQLEPVLGGCSAVSGNAAWLTLVGLLLRRRARSRR